MANIELGAFKQVFDQTKAAQDLTNTKLDAVKTVLDTLATENKLDAVRALIEALNGLVATDATLTQAKDALDLLGDVDFATNTELQEVTAALANVLIALTAIKNTDGIKKIVDPVTVIPKDSAGDEIFTQEKPGQVQLNGSNVELDGSVKVNTSHRAIQRVGPIVEIPLLAATYENHTEFVHASVLKIRGSAGLWNGYRYWMAITPFPGDNAAKENPCIFASLNGIDWVEPPGITNPVTGVSPQGSWYADPNLVYNNTTNELWLYWSQGAPAKKFVMKSSNGVTWGWDDGGGFVEGAKHELSQYTDDNYIVKDGRVWRSWGSRNMQLGDMAQVNCLDGLTWPNYGVPMEKNLKGALHHPMVTMSDAGFHFIVGTNHPSDPWRAHKDLYYGFSQTGHNIVFDPVPILQMDSDSFPFGSRVTTLYTGCLVQGESDQLWNLYFSAKCEDGTWHIGMVPCRLNNLNMRDFAPDVYDKITIPLLDRFQIREGIGGTAIRQAMLLRNSTGIISLWGRYKHKALLYKNNHNNAKLTLNLYTPFITGGQQEIDIDEGSHSEFIFKNDGRVHLVTETTLPLLGHSFGDYVQFYLSTSGDPPTEGELSLTLIMWN